MRSKARKKTRWVSAALVVAAALGLGCTSIDAPLASLRGAKLYVSGTEALEAGNLERAIADLEEAASLAPAASEIQNHLGLAYWAKGETERAGAAFEQSLFLDCENEAAQQNRASLEASLNPITAE